MKPGFAATTLIIMLGISITAIAGREARVVSSLKFTSRSIRQVPRQIPRVRADIEEDPAYILSVVSVGPKPMALPIQPIPDTEQSSLTISPTKAYSAYVLCDAHGSKDPENCSDLVYFTELRTGTVYEIRGEPGLPQSGHFLSMI
jgi:hypothetical protein